MPSTEVPAPRAGPVCAGRGALVSGTEWVPDDPVDAWPGDLPWFGCSRLRCSACGADVRQRPLVKLRKGRSPAPAALHDADWATSPDLGESPGGRLYACRCQIRLVTSMLRLDFEPRGPLDEAPPPWSCAGHPVQTLPADVAGLRVDEDTDVDALVDDVLGGRPSLPTFEGIGHHRSFWLGRIYRRLEDAADAGDVAQGRLADRLSLAMAARATGEHRAKVVDFFRAEPLAAGVDVVLDEPVVLGRRVHADPRAVARAHDVLLRPPSAGSGPRSPLLYVLADVDRDWLVGHAREVAASDPSCAPDLVSALAAGRDRIGEVVATVATVPGIAWEPVWAKIEHVVDEPERGRLRRLLAGTSAEG